MHNHVQRAAKELSSEDICQAIAFCCTVGSMIDGADFDRQLTETITSLTGVPAVTTASAVKAAFAALGVNSISLVTPYTKEITEKEKDILEKSGYRVTQALSFHHDLPSNELRNEMIGHLPAEAAYEMGLEADNPECQVVFISCTNFPTLDIIEKLEAKINKPVVTSNQATMWHALRTLDLQDHLQGFGTLLSQY
jgi:maleate isomerase